MRLALAALLLAAPLGAEGIELLEPALVRQMEAFERAVDRSFRSAGGDRPARIGPTRSIFLPSHGAVFLVEVNLAPTANVSPFRRTYTPDEIRDLNRRKRAALEPLRTKMREVVVTNGGDLTALAPMLQVTLAVSLFHFPWEDRTQLPGQIVIGAARGDLAPDIVLTTRYY